MTRITTFELCGLIAACAAILSYGCAFLTQRIAWKWHFVDEPVGGRKIHGKPMPFLGGLGIATVILTLVVLIQFFQPTLFQGLLPGQLVGYLAGIVILMIGGMIDDRHPLPPRWQIVFPIIAALCIIASGTGIVQVTKLAGHGGLSLVWWQQVIHLGGWTLTLSLPSDLFTFVWLLLATYATKVQDGLDGLVTGMTVIGAGLVGALSLSLMFFQPSIAIFAAIIGGAFLGFLPHNINPAKQFLGEGGSTLAGFSLGVLAILSSVKIAIALAVLAIPMADVAVVIIGRLRRGVPWYKGDMTHLHFRLLRAGISHRKAVFLLWGISLFAGIAALSLQTKGKFFLISGLVIATALMSYVAGFISDSFEKR